METWQDYQLERDEGKDISPSRYSKEDYGRTLKLMRPLTPKSHCAIKSEVKDSIHAV